MKPEFVLSLYLVGGFADFVLSRLRRPTGHRKGWLCKRHHAAVFRPTFTIGTDEWIDLIRGIGDHGDLISAKDMRNPQMMSIVNLTSVIIMATIWRLAVGRLIRSDYPHAECSEKKGSFPVMAEAYSCFSVVG